MCPIWAWLKKSYLFVFFLHDYDTFIVALFGNQADELYPQLVNTKSTTRISAIITIVFFKRLGSRYNGSK